MCCLGEKLRQNPDLFAVKYVIMLKYRKYPIDDQVFIDTEVCHVLHTVLKVTCFKVHLCSTLTLQLCLNLYFMCSVIFVVDTHSTMCTPV